MANLFNKLKADRIIAFKSKEEIKKNILGVLIAESSKEDKEPDDNKVITTIKKFIKNIDETISHVEVDSQVYIECSLQKDILSQYLPKQLSEEKIRSIITCDIIHKTRLANDPVTIGVVQKYFKDNYSGQYDGSIVSRIAKELL